MIYIYIYTHTYIHTLHYITLHYITLHYITLHYIHTYIHTYNIYIQYTHYIYIYIFNNSLSCYAPAEQSGFGTLLIGRYLRDLSLQEPLLAAKFTKSLLLELTICTLYSVCCLLYSVHIVNVNISINTSVNINIYVYIILYLYCYTH